MADDVMTPDLIAFVKQQKDRQEILDCLLRYTRGVDRHDRELMLSAYHPDAFDEHGVAEGVAADFCDWAIGWHREYQTKHQHIIVNHNVDLDGTTAHSETYYIFWGENREGPPTLAFGRYIDRLEKRDGRWAIAHRVCVNEKSGAFTDIEIPDEWRAAMQSTGPSRRDKTDISYLRPLVRSGV
jgi:ketosteroid isomerase-like protein